MNANEIAVGRTPAGVEWIARGTNAKAQAEVLRTRLAAMWAKHVRRIRKLSRGVTDVAAFTLAKAQEAGQDVSRVTIGATFVEAPQAFLDALAGDLENEADLIQDGMGGLAETSAREVSLEFAEAADKRRANSLRKHARRLS